jgi:hypothetical protein
MPPNPTAYCLTEHNVTYFAILFTLGPIFLAHSLVHWRHDFNLGQAILNLDLNRTAGISNAGYISDTSIVTSIKYNFSDLGGSAG